MLSKYSGKLLHNDVMWLKSCVAAQTEANKNSQLVQQLLFQQHSACQDWQCQAVHQARHQMADPAKPLTVFAICVSCNPFH
jgi:hypothetical protein